MALDFSKYEDRQRFYHSKKWKAVRELKLDKDTLCEDCLKKGKLTSGYHVHHIESLETSPHKCLRLDNLQTLCHECHSKYTAEEMGWIKESLGRVVNSKWKIDISKFKR